MGSLRRHLSYANVVASIALFLALGGGAYAVVGNRFVGRDGTIKMCVQRGDHEPQVVAPGGTCHAGSTPITVNQKGVRGPRGIRGARGATGPRGLASSTGMAPSFIDAYMDVKTFVCGGGCGFTFVSSNGTAGVLSKTADMSLSTDNSTFTVGTAGTYVVTAAVGPAGAVQLVVNGTRVGPEETSCGTTGTSVCAFQRILTIQAGSTLRLVNATSDDERDDPGSGITIVRIA